MADLVLGVGASHSTLMNTHWHEVAGLDRAERFRAGLAAARDEVAAARPDAVLLVGSNHFRGMWLDMIPQFTIGVDEVTASGESGTPAGPQTVDVPLARSVAQSLVDDEFDVAFSAALQIDHGQTHAIQYLLDGVTTPSGGPVPVVPLIVNVFAPPLPSLRRCVKLGRALRRAVDAFDQDRRVVVIGSGGLSHRLPFPDWRAPASDDQEYLVEAWRHGRTKWKDYEVRRRQIVRAFPAGINDEFDREFLGLLADGRAEEVTRYDDVELELVAGNGAHELRTWLIMAAAAGGAGRTLAYEPMPEWLTGMGVAVVAASREDAA